MHYRLLFPLVLCCLSFGVTAPALAFDAPPDAATVKSLRSACEKYLKKKVDPRLDADETYSWLVYDVESGKNLLSINGNATRQTASMVKPYIAASFFHALKKSNATYTPRHKQYMRQMLMVSANKPANWFMKQVGGPEKVQDILEDNYPDVAKTLNVVEYIPRDGRTYRNNATLENHRNLLTALWNKEIPYSDEILKNMKHRIWLTKRHGRVVDVYFKRGSTAKLIGNMILAPSLGENYNRPVILVAAFQKKTRSENYGWWRLQRLKFIGAFFRTMARELIKPRTTEMAALNASGGPAGLASGGPFGGTKDPF